MKLFTAMGGKGRQWGSPACHQALAQKIKSRNGSFELYSVLKAM
jgi:hypothetical protein